jgi:pre-mRNA-splicing factor 38A
MAKATPFLCLLLKLLAIQPTLDIVLEYVQQEEYKYLRALGAVYLRLTGRAVEVYTHLEPLLADYRKLAVRDINGWALTHMDEFIDGLLTEDTCCGLATPRLASRDTLEATGALGPRETSSIDDLLAAMDQGGEGGAAAGSSALAAVSSSTARADNRPAWLVDGSAAPIFVSSAASAAAASSSSAAAAVSFPALASAMAEEGGGGERKRAREQQPEAAAAAAAAGAGAGAPAAEGQEAKRSKPKYAPFKLKNASKQPVAEAAAAPATDSVEHWNQQRQALGHAGARVLRAQGVL